MRSPAVWQRLWLQLRRACGGVGPPPIVTTSGVVLEGGGGPVTRQRWQQWWRATTAVMAMTAGYQCGPSPTPPDGTDVSTWAKPLKMSDACAKSAPLHDIREWYPFIVCWQCVVLCQRCHCNFCPPLTKKEDMFPSAVPWGCYCQERVIVFWEGSQEQTLDEHFLI